MLDYEVVTLPEKTIVGVGTRTGNKLPDMAQKIGGLWETVFSGPYAQNASERTYYGVYTNYEGGMDGTYEALVCTQDDGSALPEGYRRIVLPAGKYARFTFQGDVQRDMGKFWAQVWSTPLCRSFTADFEEYPPCADCHNAPILIYAALAELCQSCGMPLTDEVRGTEKDGSKSAEYCTYCYQNGAFAADCTMEEMIDFCIKPMCEASPALTEEQAKAQMMEFFPALKRWQK